MSAILNKSEIDQLVRMAFMDGGSLQMLAEDGEVRGSIGESYEFRAFKVPGFRTLYQIDISEMGDGNPVIETLVYQKYSDKIPPGMPRGTIKVYSFANPLLTRDSENISRIGIIPADEGMTLEIQM